MCKTKRCFKCGEVKPLSEFYTHPLMADGHLNKCKECTRKDTRNRSPQAELQTRLKMCKKNPTHKNAYRAVDVAIKCGVLSRPDKCQGCGCPDTEHRIEAHHHDYSKPLDVIWLCTPCHERMDAEKRIREGKPNHSASRPVVMIRNGEVLCQFQSIKDAARAVKRKASSISQCLSGKAKTCAGFEWAYADTTE